MQTERLPAADEVTTIINQAGYTTDMIAMLRESGSTVKEISRFIENLTPETYLRYMRLKKEFFRQKQIEYKLPEEKFSAP